MKVASLSVEAYDFISSHTRIQLRDYELEIEADASNFAWDNLLIAGEYSG